MADQYPICAEDLKVVAIARLLNQYQSSEKFKGFIELSVEQIEQVRDAECQSLTLRDLDTATGVQLDVIGRLVGQARVVADVATFFGFATTPAAVGFDGVGRLWDGSEPITGDRVLSDPEYRLFIQARIIANLTSATVDEFLEQLALLFPTESFIAQTGGGWLNLILDPGIDSSIVTLLEFEEIDAVGQPRRFIPIALGAGLRLFTGDQDNLFGFDTNPLAKGFGVGQLIAPQ